MQVLAIGEVLWDVFPDRELLGGAALNFCVNTARLGDSAALITAVGTDARGRAARDAMHALGLTTDFVQLAADLPTGVALVSTTPDGDPRFDIPRPAAFDHVSVSHEMLRQIQAIRPDWLYFGTLLQTEPRVEQATHEIARSLSGMRCFYDMNLRPGSWNPPLVERLCHLASVVKLNDSEARTIAELTGLPTGSLEAFCQSWSARFNLEAICITLGASGCSIYANGAMHTVEGYPVSVHDTVGAGDAFAAAFLHGYQRNWPIERIARAANALGSIVAGRAGATPPWTVEEWRAKAALHH